MVFDSDASDERTNVKTALTFVLGIIEFMVISWAIMLIAGIAHAHLLDALHPIGFSAATDFGLTYVVMRVLYVLVNSVNTALQED